MSQGYSITASLFIYPLTLILRLALWYEWSSPSTLVSELLPATVIDDTMTNLTCFSDISHQPICLPLLERSNEGGYHRGWLYDWGIQFYEYYLIYPLSDLHLTNGSMVSFASSSIGLMVSPFRCIGRYYIHMYHHVDLHKSTWPLLQEA